MLCFDKEVFFGERGRSIKNKWIWSEFEKYTDECNVRKRKKRECEKEIGWECGDDDEW